MASVCVRVSRVSRMGRGGGTGGWGITIYLLLCLYSTSFDLTIDRACIPFELSRRSTVYSKLSKRVTKIVGVLLSSLSFLERVISSRDKTPSSTIIPCHNFVVMTFFRAKQPGPGFSSKVKVSSSYFSCADIPNQCTYLFMNSSNESIALW